jgi:hypothetical protein
MRTTLILITAGSVIIIASLATLLYMRAGTPLSIRNDSSLLRPMVSPPTPQSHTHQIGSTSSSILQPAPTALDFATYTNAQYGFTITYPQANLIVQPQCTDSWSTFLSPNVGSLYCCGSINGTYTSASLIIGASSDPEDVARCLLVPPSTEGQIDDAGTTTISATQFHALTVESSGTGQFETDYLYKTIRDGACLGNLSLRQILILMTRLSNSHKMLNLLS